MKRTWSSGSWGERFTRTQPWSLTLDGHFISVTAGGNSATAPVMASDHITIRQGFIWSAVVIGLPDKPKMDLDGIPNAEAREMIRVLAVARAAYLKHLKVQEQIRTFDTSVKPMVNWYTKLLADARAELTHRGWLASRFCERWQQSKPSSELDGLLNEPEVIEHLARSSPDTQNAVRLWRRDLSDFAHGVNQRHVESELVACKDFFDGIEKSPLTDEQSRAVVCFDDRVQVIASAGSGKTSTMVAKAGYALHRKLVPADKILMLAFNKDAAEELQQRVRERLAPLGFPGDAIVARTFHGLGMDIIGHATGRKPTLASWVESGRDIEHLSALVDDLKDRDATFRTQWDLFRLVFGRDLPSLDKERSDPEDWDRDTKTAGFRTLRNEVVKSHGERLLANWLFYNGVNYCYEAPYEVDTSDAKHRKYKPDFYYPDINTYHEHWALDRNGQPPKEFTNYLQAMAWKRAKHAEHGTALLETTTAGLWSGEAFAYLERELTARGITLDPNPDRPAVGQPPIDHRGLVQLFRTFLVHAKSNRLSDQDLKARLNASPFDRFRYRHHLFLALFERIRAAWENSLAEARAIDFEDMLVRAAAHLESGDWVSPFELVMVDEFQDASKARARLVRALVAKPGQRLFAVGDDWQSINRFAGADISAMTGFERWFGPAQILLLERTFRCPQTLCDVSSRFVQKNRNQLRKTVRSEATEYAPTIRMVQVPDDDRIASAVLAHLREIHAGVSNGSIPRGKNGKVSVMVLGRYNRDRAHLGPWGTLADHLDVRFHTIHGSKGLEADYVVLPRVASGRGAFPSTRQDDPVMLLAMPDGDDHPHAEERRLFYVALTRARRSVLLITVEHRFSPFIVELVRDHLLEVSYIDGTPSQTMICPKCERGTLVPRKGPYGPFLGCSRFPACDNKAKAPRSHSHPPPSRFPNH